uniref:RNA helicase n=1 Tax=Meloidogyne javanica TaxID=6303 RepID=A0A915MJ30_MELJA
MINNWVDDELHKILGYSDSATVAFIIAQAKKSTDNEDFIERLRGSFDEITNDVKIFASKLLDKVPRTVKKSLPKQKGLSQLELENLNIKRLNATLKPLDDEDDYEPSTKESDFDKLEEETQKDIEERDALSKRIKEKESKNTRHIMSKSEARSFAEAQKRLKLENESKEDKEEMLNKLRYESRKSYLNKRKEDKRMELEAQVRDDETLFARERLTKKEQLDVKYRKEVLNFVKKYDEAGNILKQKRYHVPDTSSKTIPEDYIEEPELPGGSGRLWEEEKLMAAVFHTGAKDAINKKEDLGLLLDDEHIDFVEALQHLEGTKENEEKVLSAEEKYKLSLQETRRTLPVFSYRDEFIEAVKEHQILIIEGETGSGKTTQLPQYLYESGFCSENKRIGCTQPRRVAAMSVAARVSEEMNTKIGALVGYTIRFEDCTSERTKIKYMTDGMLLREFLNEPDLASYSVLMIDEAHERTLHTDVLFGLVKDIARFRKDLKLLISSATLDALKFSTFFDDAPIFRIPGRRFPVQIYYTKAPEADYLDAAMISVLQIHLTQPLPGDILVFLTGQEEIETVQEVLQERIKLLGSRIKELIVLPIYANLPTELQSKIFEPTPPNARKCVLATNIAETSVTIDGIVYVIDPGFVKQSSYDARGGIDHLNIVTISKAAANQRAGRAGRTGPGKCFRLYTSWAYQYELEDQPIPEIQRINLGNVVLMLLSLGITDLVHFDFLDPPPYEALAAALEHLYALGALNHKGMLTKLGRRMAEFPCDPAMSKMVMASEKYECSEEIITIAAMLSVNAAIFYRPKAMVIHADTARKGFWCIENFVQHRTMKRARDIRDQLEGLLERVEIEPKSSNNPLNIQKAITSGYFHNLATLDKGGHYKTVKHRHTVQTHPNSCLFEDRPRWVIYYELVFTSKEFMREIIECDPKWIAEVAPHYYKQNQLDDIAQKKMPKQMGKTKEELTGS